MYKVLLRSLILILGLALVPANATYASSAGAATAPTAMSQKQLKKQQKLEKRMERMNKLVSKRMERQAKKGKRGLELDKSLRMCLLFLAVGLALTLAGAIIAAIAVTTVGTGLGIAGLFYLLASLAYLASGVFFILWLIEIAA